MVDELIVVRAEECRPLREALLRPGQPASAYTYAEDDHARALHFAVKTEAGAVQGVATLLPEARDDEGRELWRLRGMAVIPERRGQGLGRMLLQAVQAVVQQRGGGLWCTARTPVEAFYLAHGFVREGEVFDLSGGGPHVLMTWNGVGKRMKPKPRPRGGEVRPGMPAHVDDPDTASECGDLQADADGPQNAASGEDAAPDNDVDDIEVDDVDPDRVSGDDDPPTRAR